MGIHIFGFGLVKFTEGTNTVRVIALGYMVGLRQIATVETNATMTMNPK